MLCPTAPLGLPLSSPCIAAKMESQQSGRMVTNPAAGLMVVIENQTEREVRQMFQGSSKRLHS